MISFRFTIGNNDVKQICNLYKLAGWWDEDCSEEQISGILNHSYCFMTAWDQDKLIGMSRVISDQVSDAYIQDVFVEEKYRNQGIAKHMLECLISFCKENNVHWIALIAAPGSIKLYEKSGFERMDGFTAMKLNR